MRNTQKFSTKLEHMSKREVADVRIVLAVNRDSVKKSHSDRKYRMAVRGLKSLKRDFVVDFTVDYGCL